MVFERKWDASCPRVYDTWQADDGRQWVIQDLAPEDDEAALDILMEYLIPDEVLCALSNFTEDEESKRSIYEFWRQCLLQRMSLGCYTDVNGKKTLVAMNVCVVDTIEERVPPVEIEGVAWKNVYGAIEYIEKKCDPFKYLELDIVLHALGLVVKRDYRGAKIGSRILSARKPLCLNHGIKATATVFTGPASQKSAARSGFVTVSTVSLKELVDHGMDYPADENRVIKLMVKRYD